MPHPPAEPGVDLPADPSPEPAPDDGRRPPGSLSAHDLQNPGDVSPSSSKQSCSSSLADSRSDPARTPHPHRRHPYPLPGTTQPVDKPATTTTPGNTRSSTSMPRSPPPTAVTSSLSPDPVPGPRHDSKAINLCGWQNLLAPSGTTWIADTAYITTTATTPIKNLPNQPRTNHNKDFNTAITRIRVNIEHCTAQLKTWRILSHGHRRRLKELPRIIHLVTNLEILRTYTHNQPHEQRFKVIIY